MKAPKKKVFNNSSEIFETYVKTIKYQPKIDVDAIAASYGYNGAELRGGDKLSNLPETLKKALA